MSWLVMAGGLITGWLCFWLLCELADVWLQSRRPDADSEVWLVESDPRRTWNRI